MNNLYFDLPVLGAVLLILIIIVFNQAESVLAMKNRNDVNILRLQLIERTAEVEKAELLIQMRNYEISCSGQIDRTKMEMYIAKKEFDIEAALTEDALDDARYGHTICAHNMCRYIIHTESRVKS